MNLRTLQTSTFDPKTHRVRQIPPSWRLRLR